MVGEKVISSIYILKPAKDINKEKRLKGRPSMAKPIITAEHQRRKSAGNSLPSRSEEAAALFLWFKSKYPDGHVTEKTIYNHYLGNSYSDPDVGPPDFPE